ncbi:MAG: hypothetical protein Q9170_003701 [Blastenia crenularia]
MRLSLAIASVLCTAAFVYLSNAAPTAILDDRRSLLQPAANISNVDLVTDDHPHFTMTVYPKDNTHIESISLLMNAVDALAIIALKDPRGRSPATHFHLPGYPIATIDLWPKRLATDVVNEVATLCIYYGIEDMVRNKDQREATFSCEWDHVEVAEVVIRESPRTVQHLNEKLAKPSTIDNSNLTAPIPNALQPDFFYIRGASNLDVSLVFITIMNALLRFSRMGSSAIVGPCWTDPGPAWDSSMVFPGNGPIRRQPPFLQVIWVIKTLKLVPNFMLQNRRFAELGIVFQVDNIYLGNGLLQKGKAFHVLTSDRNATVATA